MPTGKLRQERSLNHGEENKQLIEDFLSNLLAGGRSPHTADAYRLGLKDFFDFTLGLGVADITHREISEWIHFLRVRKMSQQTVSVRLNTLRSFFIYAKQRELVRHSPADLIQIGHVPRPIPHWLTPKQIELLISLARVPRDKALVMFMFDTGCRIAEIVLVRVEHINWENRSIKVLGKGNKERMVLFGRKTEQALRDYLQERTSGPLFREEGVQQRGGVWMDQRYHTWFGQWRETTDEGKRIMRTIRLGDYELKTKQDAREALDRYLADKLVARDPATQPLDRVSIRRILADLGVRAGIGRINPHMFRHSFATAMLEGGADLRAIQELLGHSSIVTTQIYTHCSTSHLQATLEKSHPGWQEKGESNEKA